MQRRRSFVAANTVALVGWLAAATACGGSSSSSTAPTPVPAGNPQPGATSKVGWAQRASTLAQATTYNYGVYVDGNSRVSLSSVSCGAGATDQVFDCAANFPQLEAGQHSLQLVALDASGMESAKSTPPLIVTVAANGSVSFDAK